MPHELAGLTELMITAGFVSAKDEARELLACAAGDDQRLEEIVGRRLAGEPLAWITGTLSFCGVDVRLGPGVYVPRWQSEQLARRAVERLPRRGIAIEVCTGSGAIAKVMMARRPGARVVASDVDERAIACAAANGVQVYHGDLFAPLPSGLEGRVDVVIAVAPYVPTGELGLLQRDTLTFLRRDGALLLELGGDQADLLSEELERLGYTNVDVLRDEDGDVRGIEATRGRGRRTSHVTLVSDPTE